MKKLDSISKHLLFFPKRDLQLLADTLEYIALIPIALACKNLPLLLEMHLQVNVFASHNRNYLFFLYFICLCGSLYLRRIKSWFLEGDLSFYEH